MLETHPSVRCPLYGHGVSFSKFRGIDNSFRDDVRILFRRNFPFRQIIVSTLESCKSGQNLQCRIADLLHPIQVAPGPFQCRGADVFPNPFPYRAAQKIEVCRRVHNPFHRFFNLLFQFNDFCRFVVHSVVSKLIRCKIIPILPYFQIKD